MFTTIIVRPIFNLLVLIFGLLPGHNLGLAIILFTITIRIILWPLLKRQLHSAKKMRELAPELKRIKKAAAGDRQKESLMTMELYKERGVNPFASLGLVVIQLPILLGLYSGLKRIIEDPNNLVSFAYGPLQNLSFMKELAADIGKFDHTLLGFMDLTRPAISGSNSFYFPAFVLVVLSAALQYYQSKMLMPVDKDARKLRDILRGAGKGEQADASEMNAAVARGTQFIIPIMIFVLTINIASALSLYWVVGSLVAIIQQKRILDQDETEMEASISTVKVTRSSDVETVGGAIKASQESLAEALDGEVIPPAAPSSSSKAKKQARRTQAKKAKKKQRRR